MPKKKSKITVRDANPGDEQIIARLQKDVGCGIDLDMRKATGYWLVAENGHGVIGCMQARIGMPVSSLEMLAVSPDVSPVTRGRIVIALISAGFRGLAAKGVQLASATIPFKYRSYKKALERRGCRALEQGNVMVRRLR